MPPPLRHINFAHAGSRSRVSARTSPDSWNNSPTMSEAEATVSLHADEEVSDASTAATNECREKWVLMSCAALSFLCVQVNGGTSRLMPDAGTRVRPSMHGPRSLRSPFPPLSPQCSARSSGSSTGLSPRGFAAAHIRQQLVPVLL